MGEVSAEFIAKLVIERFESTSTIRLSSAMAYAMESTPGLRLSKENIAELSEQHEPKVLDHIEAWRDELEDNGVLPHLAIERDEDEPYIRRVSSDIEIAYLKSLKDLTYGEFEEFCGRILTAMGARTSAASGQPGDQGIDFYGKDMGICDPASVGARVHVVGQAKKYTSDRISETELRKFIGGAIKRVSDPSDVVYRAERLAPVIYAFWTTSDFDRGGLRFAKAVGIWHLNGIGLTQLGVRLGVQPKG